MPEPAPRWNLHSTPNPSEKSFSILLPQVEIKERISEFDIYEAGSFFRDCPLIPDEGLVEDFGDYQFTQTTDHDAEHLRYWFGPFKTDTEKKEPFRRQWSKFGNHRWHPILKALLLIENPSFPRSTNIIQNGQQGFATAPSYEDRYVYVPDVNEGTRFFTEEFTSGDPFVIPRYRVPVPTSVQYSTGDLRGSFQECLHDDIDIPATRSANAVFLGDAAFSASGSIEGQNFPRTNFKTWLPYVLYDEQELMAGLWYRKRIRVFPPPRPKAIRRA